MKVLKFGRSATANAETIGMLTNIVNREDKPCVVVVSTYNGFITQLDKIGMLAVEKNPQYKKLIGELLNRELEIIDSLCPKDKAPEVKQYITDFFGEVEELFHGVFLLQELTPKVRDRIFSYATRSTAILISRIVKNATYLDVQDIIRTDCSFGNAKVDEAWTESAIQKQLSNIKQTTVIPGYFGYTTGGDYTYLGRRGGDYTAALIAAALEAEVLELWMDVDGFMSADPEIAKRTNVIKHLTYAEAIELSHFDTTVIYTPTISPIYKKNIPLRIKNTFNLQSDGTLIHNTPYSHENTLIKGIASINDIVLITLQGTRMVGATDISERMFSIFTRHKINIVLVTQASSEYSLSIGILPSQLHVAEAILKEEFGREIMNNQNIRLLIERDLSIVAIVGEKMKNKPGISATLFSALSRNGISVIATAQGSSELNISVVIRKDQLGKAIYSIHESFFLSKYKELNLFITGVGNVGNSLVKQIEQQQQKLKEEFGLQINIMGIANSKRILLSDGIDGIDTGTYKALLSQHGEPYTLTTLVEKIAERNVRNAIFVDCTGSADVSSLYKDLLKNYISIVTANKVACSSEYEQYKTLKDLARDNDIKFLFETNVGAGLPIINTIRDLKRSGDKIIKIEAVVSGTLNYLFNTVSQTSTLSATIRKAKELGYSEPDPRLDLNGMDVVRKLVILARESGYAIEKDDVQLTPFLPKECFEGDIDAFWKSVETLDATWIEKYKQLQATGKKWRFIAQLDNGKASVSLQEVDGNHPSYNLEGSNNIVMITTERYYDQPMVIKGYGAGAEVTAAGVFADIIRVANI